MVHDGTPAATGTSTTSDGGAVDVAVISVLFGFSERVTGDIVRDLVRAIDEHVGASVELILVNNDSRVDVRASSDHVTVVQGQGNIGFGRGVNAGIARARASAVLLWNPDCVVDEAFSTLLDAAADSAPDAIYSPLLAGPDGETVARPFTSWTFLPARLYGRALAEVFIHLSHRSSLPRGLKLPGTALYARRSTLSALGPFDESFFLYGEDRDLAWRARATGMRLLVNRQIRVSHAAGSSGSEVPHLVRSAQADAALRIAERRYGRLGIVVVSVELMVSCIRKSPRRTRHLLAARTPVVSGWLSIIGSPAAQRAAFPAYTPGSGRVT